MIEDTNSPDYGTTIESSIDRIYRISNKGTLATVDHYTYGPETGYVSLAFCV